MRTITFHSILAKAFWGKASFACVLGMAAVMMSCENDNINPYDYAGGTQTDTIYVNPGNSTFRTAVAEYPVGSIVWAHDTTLTESMEVPVGRSLYIEPGVTVTCAASAKVPVELVVLGNLYCMGTAEKPVTFKSDNGRPADWGGIICGFNSEEVVLNHVDISDGGATPTEASLSFQNKLFKTTIDGGVPAFHFCNTNGKFVIANSFFHSNYNDQTYFTGGNGVIYHNIFADSGNAADGGEAINVKAGCNLDIAYNLIYNACTNAFKLSDAGTSETIKESQLRIYNNTVADCGWRRSKNKKGGSIWLEKGIYGIFVNNLIYDCRYGIRQPKKDGANLEKSTLTPNYYFASTEDGVKQMAKDYSLIIYYDSDIHSATAGGSNPLLTQFEQNSKMSINCEVDDVEQGAPLAWNATWDFHLQAGSPALNGGFINFKRIFENGLAMFGMKKVTFLDSSNDQNYYFCCPAPSNYFGAFGQKN